MFTQLTSSKNRFKSCCLPESGRSFRLEVNIHLWGSFVLKWPPCLKCSHSLIVLTAEWTKRPKGCFKTSALLILCYWHSWQHTWCLESMGPLTMNVQPLTTCLWQNVWVSRRNKRFVQSQNVRLHHPGFRGRKKANEDNYQYNGITIDRRCSPAAIINLTNKKDQPVGKFSSRLRSDDVIYSYAGSQSPPACLFLLILIGFRAPLHVLFTNTSNFRAILNRVNELGCKTLWILC